MPTSEYDIKSLIVIFFFSSIYLYRLALMTARQKIDLYDLVMLSSVAIVPALFELFPRKTLYLANSIGVAFPFVIVFSSLFAILFIFIHRLTMKVRSLENINRKLIQELSLLSEAVKNTKL